MGGSERKYGRLELETRESQRIFDRGATEDEEYDSGGGHGPSDGSVWGSVFNLCNSAIGAGILALPYAIHQSGIVLGMICMVVMCITLGFTNKILVWTNRLNPEAKSYEKLVKAVFGHKTSILVTWSVILTTFGACTGFLVIIADILPPIVKLVVSEPEWVSSRVAVTLAVSVVGILPLASLKNFNSLRFSSTMAIISVSFTVFVIMFKSARDLPLTPEEKSQLTYFNYGMGVFDALPLICFAFGCHMQMIPIFNELKDNDKPSRINTTIVCTGSVCLLLYSITATFGMLIWEKEEKKRKEKKRKEKKKRKRKRKRKRKENIRKGEKYNISAGYLQFPKTVTGNILKNFPDDDVLVNIARAMLCFVIVCHYPPSNYCCRAALDYLFMDNAPPSTPRRLIWTFIIWGLAAITSFLVPKINVVFGLIGATANSLIVFIFPALFLIHCTTASDWEGVNSFPAYLIGVTILVVGIIISIFGTAMIIIDNWFPNALDF